MWLFLRLMENLGVGFIARDGDPKFHRGRPHLSPSAPRCQRGPNFPPEASEIFVLSSVGDVQPVADICMAVMKEMGRLMVYGMLIWPGLLPASGLAWPSEERGEGREQKGTTFAHPPDPHKELGSQVPQREF